MVLAPSFFSIESNPMARSSFWVFVCLGGLMGFALPLVERGGVAIAADAWEADFAKWESAEQNAPPPAEPVLFVGSSSIRLWNLAESFPQLPVVNHGFGGSQVSDTLANLERIVLRYKPRTIVCYAGDNDIAAGKSPEQVAHDVAQVVEQIHTALPQTRFVYIAIKPSIARWKLIDKVRSANAQIAASMKDDPLASFMQIETEMLGADGLPRKELFVADGLHLNAEGYRLWTKLLLPQIDATTK